MHSKLARLTLFLAPSGMFFLPIPALGSFRAFYIPLFLLNILAVAHLRRRQLSEIALLIFVIAVFWISASYGYARFSGHSLGMSANPWVRWAVIANLIIGFYFLGYWLEDAGNSSEWFKRMDIPYHGFILLFILGFLLYASVVYGPVPRSVYRHFVTIEQSAFGYMRLSPGTYPNEFGTLCSFFALYALIKNSREGGVAPILVALMSLVGIALTSTRSAYATLVVGASIVVIGIPSMKRQTQVIIATLIAVPSGLLILNALSFNTLSVLHGGYTATVNHPTQGSLGARLQGWSAAYDQFTNFPFLGFGFEAPGIIYLHNLFLQEFFGLGLIGCATTILLSILFWLTRKGAALNAIPCDSAADRRYMTLIRLVALEHVILFGTNNHNQTHFLTWLAFALFVVNIGNVKATDILPTPARRPRN